MQLNGKNHGSYIGHPTVQNTPVSNCLRQENLTKWLKKIISRDTYTYFYKMAQLEDGSRSLGSKALALLTAAGLAASSPAGAETEADATNTVSHEVASSSVTKVTRAQCRVIADKVEKIACYKASKAQSALEMAALDQKLIEQQAEKATLEARIKNLDAENAAIDGRNKNHDETIADQNREAKQLDTTHDVLTKQVQEAEQKIEARILGPAN